jgi:hypothetical protein
MFLCWNYKFVSPSVVPPAVVPRAHFEWNTGHVGIDQSKSPCLVVDAQNNISLNSLTARTSFINCEQKTIALIGSAHTANGTMRSFAVPTLFREIFKTQCARRKADPEKHSPVRTSHVHLKVH